MSAPNLHDAYHPFTHNDVAKNFWCACSCALCQGHVEGLEGYDCICPLCDCHRITATDETVSLDTITNAIERHDPSHGINCVCMDAHIQAIRRYIVSMPDSDVRRRLQYILYTVGYNPVVV